jgi:hypothetical protein
MLETQAPVTISRRPPFSGRQALWPTVLLIGYVAAGIIVTWPLATYQGGRLPDIPDPASYLWSLWWVDHQVTHLSNPTLCCWPPRTAIPGRSPAHPGSRSRRSRASARPPFYARLDAVQYGHPSDRRQVRLARANARRLDIGWVLARRRAAKIGRFLTQVGFRFGYRAAHVSVYHPPPSWRPDRLRTGDSGRDPR